MTTRGRRVRAAITMGLMWGEFLVFGPPLTITSAVCAAGSLAMAKRAERRELRSPTGDPTEGELAEGER